MRPIAWPTAPRTNKFGARKRVVDGHVFDSLKEAWRYGELVVLLRAEKIRSLTVHPKFTLWASSQVHARVPDTPIGHFTLDFQYFDLTLGRMIYEDVKGGRATKTEAYQLRKKILAANYGITITEI